MVFQKYFDWYSDLDYVSKVAKNKKWPVTNSFSFSSEQKYGGQETLNLQTEGLPLKKGQELMMIAILIVVCLFDI